MLAHFFFQGDPGRELSPIVWMDLLLALLTGSGDEPETGEDSDADISCDGLEGGGVVAFKDFAFSVDFFFEENSAPAASQKVLLFLFLILSGSEEEGTATEPSLKEVKYG